MLSSLVLRLLRLDFDFDFDFLFDLGLCLGLGLSLLGCKRTLLCEKEAVSLL